MNRYFTLSEAQALLPRVQSLLAEAVEAKGEADELGRELERTTTRIAASGGMEIDPSAFARSKAARSEAVGRAQKALQEIQGMGVLVKDLDIGLIDFPALRDGEEVYLCWKLGEERIEWWHRVEDGFAGRRPILDGFDPLSETGSGEPN